MDRDQFFSHIFDENSDAAEASREQKQLAFEERVIKRLFRECGIKIVSWGRLVNECREISGQPVLNFRWFNSSFKFPAVLCGKRLYTGRRGPALADLVLRDLLKPPDKNRAAKLISRVIADQGVNDDDFFVFVFPVAHKMFCAHNMSQVDAATGTRLTVQTPKDIMHIEATDSLFRAVGTNWWEN